MAHMDIFNDDAFGLVAMTEAVEKMPTVPTFLGNLGIFADEGVTTDVVSIEQKGMTLELIPTSQRGTEPPMGSTDKRSLRHFSIPRIAKGDQVFAREVQNLRAFGTESELESVIRVIAQKQNKLLTEHALTMEYHRLGALQGILLDADGSTLYNYFTEFGITQPTEIDFDLDNASPTAGALKNKIAAAKRTAIRALGGSYVPGITRFLWLCGDTFYDQFTAHSDVRSTYANWEAAQALRGSVGSVFSTFSFGEMEWHNYQGTDDNSTVAITSTQAKLVVLGVPGLYRRINGPGESMETVNTMGLPIYSNLVRDEKRNQWVQPEIFSYPLHICTRPEVLLRGKNT
ncbi:major capsid protein [Novosphingobium sp. KN65.2]|uniref:major capsid protein n=1 Tax=Novosphingobium sp. KN65.2 TaxID=1478134 RepID=UPI0005E3B9A6|nr:major capsid protein [Novosphingobium sp. KN65.2]CDO34051.1 putative phage protein Gp20 [Novosphingobium sp. KN65.2]